MIAVRPFILATSPGLHSDQDGKYSECASVCAHTRVGVHVCGLMDATDHGCWIALWFCRAWPSHITLTHAHTQTSTHILSLSFSHEWIMVEMIKECGLVCAICADLKSVRLSLCLHYTMSSLYLHFSYNNNEERSYCESYAILSYSRTLRHLTAGKSRVLLPLLQQQQLALSV